MLSGWRLALVQALFFVACFSLHMGFFRKTAFTEGLSTSEDSLGFGRVLLLAFWGSHQSEVLSWNSYNCHGEHS